MEDEMSYQYHPHHPQFNLGLGLVVLLGVSLMAPLVWMLGSKAVHRVRGTRPTNAIVPSCMPSYPPLAWLADDHRQTLLGPETGFTPPRHPFSTDNLIMDSTATPIHERYPAMTVQDQPLPAEPWSYLVWQQVHKPESDISSVDGLMRSPEYQEYARKRKKSPVLESQQYQAKVQMYKDMRAMDPDGFQKLWSRRDLKAYESYRSPRLILLLDYTIWLGTAVAACVCWLTADTSVLKYGPGLAWLLLQMRDCWAGGRSVLLRLCSVYLVQNVYQVDEDDDNHATVVHQQPADAWLGFKVLLFEALFVSCTLLLGGLVSLLMVLFCNRTMSQYIMQVYLVREVSKPIHFGLFRQGASTARLTAGSSTGQELVDAAVIPGVRRYGVND